MRRTRIIMPLMLALMLVACKFTTNTELYVTDLELLAAGKVETVPANISVAVEMPSSTKCQEMSREVTSLLGQYFRKIKFDKCASKGFNDYLMVRGQLPVVSVDKARTLLERDKGFLFFLVGQKGSMAEVTPYIDKERYSQFRDLVDQRYGVAIESGDLEMDIVLRNDSKGERKIQVCSAYVDRAPIPLCGSITLSGREHANVQVSKIQTEYLVKKGLTDYPIITINK